VRIKILYWLGWFLTRVLGTIVFRVRVRGREHIPRSGGFILASNHISYYDPPLVGSFQRRELYFMAKKELFRNKLFGAVITSTNSLPIKRGAVDRRAIELCSGVLASGFGLVMFPEGTRAPKGEFLPAKPGLGMLAVAARVPIVPCYIHGSNDLKACFWGKDRMSITYGEPFPAEWVESFGDSKASYQALAEAVMGRIAEIKRSVVEARHSLPGGQCR
jgi:1-acyl-sn-glycerol-3-phosphate acyltransferase